MEGNAQRVTPLEVLMALASAVLEEMQYADDQRPPSEPPPSKSVITGPNKENVRPFAVLGLCMAVVRMMVYGATARGNGK